MQLTSVIDIALWDKAGWSGTVFGVCPDRAMMPFVGPLFKDADHGRRIFERWRKFLGDLDVHELIQVSIVEGDISGEQPGYTVYIGTNPHAAIDLANIRRPAEASRLIMMTGRFCRMCPEAGSRNLPNFKKAYEHSQRYLLLPVTQEDLGITPILGVAIEKRSLRFVQASELSENDAEVVVLRRENHAVPTPSLTASAEDNGTVTGPSTTVALALLEAELAAGRVTREVDPMLADSLADVRYDEDGKVIPDSVNPMLSALAMLVMDDVLEEHALTTPLRDVQAEYVKCLDSFFVQPFEEMIKHGATPHDVATDLASSKDNVKRTLGLAPDLRDALSEFWRSNGLILLAHLRSQATLRAVYGGNVFPDYESNFASNLALYADTLVLPDPLLRTSTLCDSVTPERLTYILVKSGLTAMTYRNLALADTPTPIIVFVPTQVSLSDSLGDLLQSLSLEDIRLHAQKVFAHDFSDIDAVRQYIHNFNDDRDLAAAVKDASRFLFDADANPLPLDQIACLMEVAADLRGQVKSESTDPRACVIGSFEGRFMQASETIAQADLYGGIPVVDAPTSWQYLLWKYEYATTGLRESGDRRDLLIQHALQTHLRDMPALRNVPNETVLELRRLGVLAELRETFRKGVGTIMNASNDTVEGVTQQVAENLRNALAAYENDVEKLAAERKGLLGSAALSSASLGIGLAGAVFGGVPLGIAGIISGSVGVNSAVGLYGKVRSLLATRERLKRNPVGLFFRARA